MTDGFAPYRRRRAVWVGYVLFVLLPIWWLVIISLMTQAEATGGLSFLPDAPSLAAYLYILTDRAWVMGFVNAGLYTALNVAISLVVAVPAA